MNVRWLLPALAVALGCNQLLGIEPPTDRNGGAGGATGTAGAGGSSGGTTGAGGRGATGGGGTMGTGGRGGASGTTGTGGTGGSTMVPCASRQASDAIGIYVSASGADGASCGSRAQPCKTIQAGIGRAQTLGRAVVYVNAGSYAETLVLAAGIRVEGAWGAVGVDWSPICTAAASDAVVVQSPGAATTVTADALGGAAGLAYLTVKSKAAAAAGESLYGIVARGATTTLDLEEVKINVAAGGNGAAVTKAADGMSGTGTCTPAGDGAKGSDGMLGAGAMPGTFSMTGYTPSDGSTGPQGGTGHNGASATGAACVTPCFSTCSSTGGSCSYTYGPDSCGMNDGIPGCGGRGGAGGLGGRGGGSSIALFVWGATANVVGGSLVAGNGGQGTVGGTGGNGGPGAAGTEGTKGAICRTGSCIYQTTNGCQALLTNAQGMGGFGGSGGPGGPGGQGGAGAGGSSFALFKGTGAGVTVSGSTTLTIGPAGTSAGNGAAGVAKTVGP